MDINLDRYPGITYPSLLARDVEVWLPPQYLQYPEEKFPVLYMHDGQNLFIKHKFIKQTWKIAENITELSNSGAIRPAIVVGIANTANRVGEYLPAGVFSSPESHAYLQKMLHQYNFDNLTIASDAYLKLIVEVIKPMIDGKYRTHPGRSDTFIMGSSMGGLISLYALCEYPGVFGGAGCLSTHWPIVGKHILPYLEAKLPSAGTHKLYFDHGSRGIDSNYKPYQSNVDQLMVSKGYRQNIDWLSRYFPGAWHNEYAWSKRIKVPLEFFLSDHTCQV